MRRRAGRIVLLLLVLLLTAAGCGGGPNGKTEDETEMTANEGELTREERERQLSAQKYDGAYSAVNGTLAARDALGRVLPLDVTVEERADGTERSVGIFYFLWMGQHGAEKALDNSVIEQKPRATESELLWQASGGGAVGETHFWGKPLFGYYTSDDVWVQRKHVQMLADAGVDYLVFDTTNGYTYTAQALRLMKILAEYQKAGIRVPQVAFYTNSSSGRTINQIYTEIYQAHPEYEPLWFRWDGKPMIIGVSADSTISTEARAFFRIKESVWPNAGRTDDGFPWMEFSRLLSDRAVYGQNGVKEVLNVSIAQHSATCTMSATAYYGANDRTRSWHDGKNDPAPDAALYGYNFAEQWKWALAQDVRSIFVTGWNEWGAQRQPATAEYPVRFIDCCNANTSRDAEPMEGGFGDNYYMQLIDGIRRFKGTAPRVDIGGYTTVDISGSPSAFDGAAAVYSDYTNDDVGRSAVGFGGIRYSDDSGMNDIAEIRVLRDRENLYFRITADAPVKLADREGRMTLWLRTGENDCPLGYDFAVNRAPMTGDGAAVIERWTKDGWQSVGTAACRVTENVMMLAVPRDLLGIPGYDRGELDLVDLQFKVSDGCCVGSAANDVFSFYKSGDAAPLGRLNYVYSNKK